MSENNGIQIITEEKDYFYYLLPEYRRIVDRFVANIETLATREEKLDIYISVQARIEEILPSYVDNAKIRLVLEYLDYQVLLKLEEYEKNE